MNRHCLLGLVVVCLWLLLAGGCNAPMGQAHWLSGSRNTKTTSPAKPEAGYARRTLRATSTDVRAGVCDDNRQYNYYLSYLRRFSHRVEALPLNPADRLTVRVLDSAGLPVPNCTVLFGGRDEGMLARRTTAADGTVIFLPHQFSRVPDAGKLVILDQHETIRRPISLLSGPRAITVVLDRPRAEHCPVPLDIALVLDTTGSMGDEIQKLKDTLRAIHFRITQLQPRPDVRFAMVLYRDNEDEYRTRVVEFTGDVDAFAMQLDAVTAEGGGDKPEDLQQALDRTVNELAWRDEAVKLAFVLGDAPPHLDYMQRFTYVDACNRAGELGLRITTIGASGLDEQGEFIFRQIAQATRGQFIFLTYGEKGESSGANNGVSHHTGENWTSRNLDAIIVQSVAKQLSYLSNTPVRESEEYFSAEPAEGITDEAVMGELFDAAVGQLIDYAQVQLPAEANVAVIPARASPACPSLMVESLCDRLVVSLHRAGAFRLLERDQLQAVTDEVDFTLSQATTDEGLDKIRSLGRRLSADWLVLSKVRRSGSGYEMFIKLVRVTSGQVVSATMLKIDSRLLATSTACR